MARSCRERPHHHRAARTIRTHRARCAAGSIACFVLACAYLVQAWRIVFTLRIGPVIAVLDEAHGHGVHSGDMIGLGCLMLAVGLLVVGALLLDDATGSSARFAPAIATARRHRHTGVPTATSLFTGPQPARAARRPALAHHRTRSGPVTTRRRAATRRSRRAWASPIAAG